MRYSLRRVSDGEGSEGRRSHSIQWHEDDTYKDTISDRPTVGCSMMVAWGIGDYWLTTLVTEILEDTPDMVRFKTKNSEYIWKIIESS